MPRALRIVLTAVAIAALAVAVVLVVEGPGGTPPEVEGTGASAGSSDQVGSADVAPAPAPESEQETRAVSRGSGDGLEPSPARAPTDGSGEPAPTSLVLRRADPTPAYEGAVGPSVGRTPEQAARPFRVPHRADRGEDLELREQEERFFNRMSEAYDVIAASLVDCAAGLPLDARDTVFYSISVTDDFENTERGAVEIQHFASNLLTDDREQCARDALRGFDFPPPWTGRTGEGPGFTSSADSRIQYDVEFEFEVGPE